MEYQDKTQEISEVFSDLNLTIEEVNILRKARIVSFYNGTIKVLLGSVPEDQFKAILEVCKDKQGIIIKLFQKDIPAVLRQGISLSEENYDVEYSCDTVAQAPLYLTEQLGIRRVLIGARQNKTVQMMDKDKYERIYNKMQHLIKGISPHDSEKMRFKEVYTRLAKYLTYDNKVAKVVIKMDEAAIENDEKVIAARNLEGAILEGRCVCVGFAEALKQTLSLVGIESELCDSKFDKDDVGHTYNQVKIEGKWYNVDLTMDYENIRKGIRPKYCLKSDKDFALKSEKDKPFHTPIAGQDSHQCTESLEIYEEYRVKRHKNIWKKLKRFFRRSRNQLLLGAGTSVADIKKQGIESSKKFRDSYKVQSDVQYIKEQDTKQIQKSEEERGR